MCLWQPNENQKKALIDCLKIIVYGLYILFSLFPEWTVAEVSVIDDFLDEVVGEIECELSECPDLPEFKTLKLWLSPSLSDWFSVKIGAESFPRFTRIPSSNEAEDSSDFEWNASSDSFLSYSSLLCW